MALCPQICRRHRRHQRPATLSRAPRAAKVVQLLSGVFTLRGFLLGTLPVGALVVGVLFAGIVIIGPCPCIKPGLNWSVPPKPFLWRVFAEEDDPGPPEAGASLRGHAHGQAPFPPEESLEGFHVFVVTLLHDLGTESGGQFGHL